MGEADWTIGLPGSVLAPDEKDARQDSAGLKRSARAYIVATSADPRRLAQFRRPAGSRKPRFSGAGKWTGDPHPGSSPPSTAPRTWDPDTACNRSAQRTPGLPP